MRRGERIRAFNSLLTVLSRLVLPNGLVWLTVGSGATALGSVPPLTTYRFVGEGEGSVKSIRA